MSPFANFSSRLTILAAAAAAGALVASGASAASAATPRIVGGEQTTIDAAPYAAQLLEGDRFACTASAIADTWVITAKHCVDKGGDFDVLLGSAGREQGTKYGVKSVHQAPAGDVALVELATAYSGPTIDLGKNAVPVDTQGDIFGWGWEDALGFIWGGSKNLKTAKVKVIGDSTDAYGASAYNVQGVTGKIMPGDSGGPLVVDDKLVAITSSGTAADIYPTSFANHAKVSLVTDWVEKTSGVVAK